MTTKVDPNAVVDEELTREEGAALFDQAARRWMGMSGESFLAAWDAGHFRDEAERTEVSKVALLIPFVR
jgi:hypothetical protein